MKNPLIYCLSTLFLCCFVNSTPLSAQVTDIDGNAYAIITIGNQEWMGSNLRTSRLNTGTAIPVVTDSIAWLNNTNPVSCWYGNDSALHNIDYGRLYNGYSALDPNICPTGWAIPTVRDWDEMVTFLGGSAVAGGALKQVGFEYWFEPNTGATNSSGFSAMPTGYRSQTDGSFNYKGQRAGWFVLAPSNSLAFRFVSWSIANAGSGPIMPAAGLAIRCMRPVPSTSSTNTLELQSFKIYPNPVRGLLNVQLPEYLAESKLEMEVYDMQGRKVFASALFSQQNQLDLSELKGGSYLLVCKKSGAVLHQQKLLLIP